MLLVWASSGRTTYDPALAIARVGAELLGRAWKLGCPTPGHAMFSQGCVTFPSGSKTILLSQACRLAASLT